MSSPGSQESDDTTPAGETPQRFVYPALDLSKSEFRILFLQPGQYDDEIKAKLLTFPLPALPVSFKEEGHFTQLDEVFQALSTAMSQRRGIQFGELFRWQRLCEELDELFINRLLAELVRNGTLKPSDSGAPQRLEIQADDNMNKLREMKDSLITLAEDFQRTTSHPFETAELEALIGHLRSNRNGEYTLTSRYEAVSYCCGDQRPKTQIDLDGCGVNVPATAAHALRGLRKKNKIRILWIDALCIDQGNTTERAHQVLQLAKIYSCAERTLVWLGDEDNTQDASFSTCWEDILRSVKFAPQGVTPPRGAELISRHQGEAIYRVPASVGESPSLKRAYQDAVSAIVALLSKYLKRPWFNRLWMYQEVLLAQECVCFIGPYELEWSYVQQAFNFSKWPNESSNIDELGPYTPWMREMFTSPPSASNVNAAPSLKQLLLRTVPLKCSDDRDKVYALLGLTRWSKRRETIPLEVWPDYAKSTADCMRDATSAVIREDADLDWLLLRTLTGPKPTWMIPWHQLGDNMSVVNYLEIHHKVRSSLDCSRGLTFDCDNIRRPGAPDSLFLRGLRFRKIARVSPVSSEKDVQNMTIVAKLRVLLEQIDSVTNGRLAKVDSRVICYTICRNLHQFSPRLWWLPDSQHNFCLKRPVLHCLVQNEQKGDSEDKQCTEHRRPGVKEADVRCEEKEWPEESSSDKKEESNSSGHPTQIFSSRSSYQNWVEARISGTFKGRRATKMQRPTDRFVLEQDVNTSSDDKYDSGRVASIVHRAIVTLQDNCHSNLPLDINTSEMPGLEEMVGGSFHLNSSLHHCLTKSRFYIPAPDWSETTPLEVSIGIGPAEMEPGDQVAILFGCKRPVILRPEGSAWLYVGPAYAHEMMAGDFVSYWEYFREQGYTGVESEVFELR